MGGIDTHLLKALNNDTLALSPLGSPSILLIPHPGEGIAYSSYQKTCEDIALPPLLTMQLSDQDCTLSAKHASRIKQFKIGGKFYVQWMCLNLFLFLLPVNV